MGAGRRLLRGIRSGGDREFCWRLQAAGWRLGYVPEALVEHRHRTTLRALVRLRARYGACAGWLVRHDDVPFMRPRPYWLARHLAVAAAHAARGRRESAVFHLLDAVMFLTWCAGYLLENRSPAVRAPGADPHVIVVLDEFPDEHRGWTAEAVRAVSPARLRIEARRRASRPVPWTLRDLDIRYAEDDGFLASAWERLRLLVARRALRIPRDGAAREARIADTTARVLRRPTSPAQLGS